MAVQSKMREPIRRFEQGKGALGQVGRAGISRWVLLGACLLASACGSKAEPVESAAPDESSGSERDPSDAEDPLSITGLRGTLSQEEIRGALEPRMPKFSRCVQKRSGDVEWISGALAFEFRVATDGSVSSVFPSRSSMGDRATETCMVELARATRFPRPHGGEAEFSWSLEVPLDPEVREPVSWSSADTGDVLVQRQPELAAQCGPGPFDLTAYIDVEGKVVAVGGAVADEAHAAQLDCVTQAVSSWVFPSPGSYAAKLSFRID
jgi:hypothetical protein